MLKICANPSFSYIFPPLYTIFSENLRVIEVKFKIVWKFLLIEYFRWKKHGFLNIVGSVRNLEILKEEISMTVNNSRRQTLEKSQLLLYYVF